MRDRIKIKQAIIVEGKYDKIALENLFDALIVETDGFNIFTNPEKLGYIKKLAETRGIIIFTDSDSAGNRIRGFLTGSIDPHCIIHAYAPEIVGREKRKAVSSKERLLGVEGMDPDIILQAVASSGCEAENPVAEKYSYSDLFSLGLTGSGDSRRKRTELLIRLGLPSNLSTARLLKYLNTNSSEIDLNMLLKSINNEK